MIGNWRIQEKLPMNKITYSNTTTFQIFLSCKKEYNLQRFRGKKYVLQSLPCLYIYMICESAILNTAWWQTKVKSLFLSLPPLSHTHTLSVYRVTDMSIPIYIFFFFCWSKERENKYFKINISQSCNFLKNIHLVLMNVFQLVAFFR